MIRSPHSPADGRVEVMAHPPTMLFVVLCGVGFLSFISYNLVRMPALAPFTESLGASPALVGMVIAASTMTGVLLKLPMGVLSDVINRRRLMLIGILAFAFPPFAYPHVTDVETLIVLRVVHGLATATFTPLALAMVAEMYQDTRGAALGWYTSAAQGGALVGPVLGGWLVDQSGFSLTFEIAGVFGVLALLLYMVVLAAPSSTVVPPKVTTTTVSDLLASVKRVISHSQMRMTSLAEAAKMMANGTLMAFLPLYGLSVGLSLAEGGWLFGVQGLTSFVAKPFMGRVSDRVGRRPLIMLGLVICGLAIMGISQTTGFVFLLLLAAVFGFGEAVVTSSSAALIADLSGGQRLGAGMGLRGTIMDIGHAGGPIVAGVLVGTIGYTGGFIAIGSIQLVAALGFGAVMYRTQIASSSSMDDKAC
ncbi:MAG: MFS transporter [Nitrospirales bacterium]|nr:MFS transporter [Nitrospirales bacterium]